MKGNQENLTSEIIQIISKKFSGISFFDGYFYESKIAHRFYDLFIVDIYREFYKQQKNISIQEFIEEYIKNELYCSKPQYQIFVNYQDYINNYYSSIYSDFPDLKKNEIHPLGDLHGIGTVKFKYKEHFYYKNNLNSEIFLDEVTKKLKIFEPFLLKSEVLGKYRKRNFIQFDNQTTNLNEYYYNLGLVYSFVLGIRAVDIIYENIIINSNNPILFDLDFILYPEYSKKNYYGISQTGLLIWQRKKHPNNTSSTFGGLYPMKSFLKPQLSVDKKNEYEISWESVEDDEITSIPNLNNSHPIEYLSKIKEGYDKGSKIILENRDFLINTLKDLNFNVRLVTRRTMYYRYILMHLAYEDNIQEHGSIDKLFSSLLDKEHLLIPKKYDTSKLMRYEVNMLKQFRYPYFFANINSKNFNTLENEVVAELHKSPIESYLDYMENLEQHFQKNLNNIQIIFSKEYKEWLKFNKFKYKR